MELSYVTTGEQKPFASDSLVALNRANDLMQQAAGGGGACHMLAHAKSRHLHAVNHVLRAPRHAQGSLVSCAIELFITPGNGSRRYLLSHLLDVTRLILSST